MNNAVEEKCIFDLVEIYNNVRVPLSSKERENLDKIYPYYGAQGIVDYVDNYLFDGEYILVAEDGENLRSNNQNICNLVRNKFWVNNHAHILRANKMNITKYLYYNFNQIKFESHVTGSAQPKLNKENLLNIRTFVHSKNEQIKIVSVLSALDDKIELNNKLNDNLEQMVKTIYDYWFVQFDFPNEDGKPYKSSGGKMVYNNELKREIPIKWTTGDVSDLGEVVGGSTPPREIDEYFTTSGTAWITPKDLSQNKGNKFIANGELDVSENGIKNASLRIMPKGTVLLSTRAPIGYLAISQDKVTTNQGFKSFVPNKGFSTEFIYYSIKNLIPTIENNAVGSTFKEISASTLKTIPICLPKQSILKAYDKLITPFFNKQNILENQNKELAQLRDWLLPMLMNGQVTVK